jgi:hypothetical protein
MTTVAFEASDLITLVANIKDRESLQLVSRVVQAQAAIMEAQVAQFKQLQGVLNERISSTK